MHKKSIIIVVGQICGGKSYFIQTNLSQKYRNSEVIKIGDIVRSLKGSVDRLIDESLDTAIIEHLTKRIKESSALTVIIDGIRQMSIYEALIRFSFTSNIPIEREYFCTASCEERKRRYLERQDIKDSKMSFDVADRQDSLLFKELEDYAQTHFTLIN